MFKSLGDVASSANNAFSNWLKSNRRGNGLSLDEVQTVEVNIVQGEAEADLTLASNKRPRLTVRPQDGCLASDRQAVETTNSTPRDIQPQLYDGFTRIHSVGEHDERRPAGFQNLASSAFVIRSRKRGGTATDLDQHVETKRRLFVRKLPLPLGMDFARFIGGQQAKLEYQQGPGKATRSRRSQMHIGLSHQAAIMPLSGNTPYMRARLDIDGVLADNEPDYPAPEPSLSEPPSAPQLLPDSPPKLLSSESPSAPFPPVQDLFAPVAALEHQGGQQPGTAAAGLNGLHCSGLDISSTQHFQAAEPSAPVATTCLDQGTAAATHINGSLAAGGTSAVGVHMPGQLEASGPASQHTALESRSAAPVHHSNASDAQLPWAGGLSATVMQQLGSRRAAEGPVTLNEKRPLAASTGNGSVPLSTMLPASLGNAAAASASASAMHASVPTLAMQPADGLSTAAPSQAAFVGSDPSMPSSKPSFQACQSSSSRKESGAPPSSGAPQLCLQSDAWAFSASLIEPAGAIAGGPRREPTAGAAAGGMLALSCGALPSGTSSSAMNAAAVSTSGAGNMAPPVFFNRATPAEPSGGANGNASPLLPLLGTTALASPPTSFGTPLCDLTHAQLASSNASAATTRPAFELSTAVLTGFGASSSSALLPASSNGVPVVSSSNQFPGVLEASSTGALQSQGAPDIGLAPFGTALTPAASLRASAAPAQTSLFGASIAPTQAAGFGTSNLSAQPGLFTTFAAPAQSVPFAAAKASTLVTLHGAPGLGSQPTPTGVAPTQATLFGAAAAPVQAVQFGASQPTFLGSNTASSQAVLFGGVAPAAHAAPFAVSSAPSQGVPVGGPAGTGQATKPSQPSSLMFGAAAGTPAGSGIAGGAHSHMQFQSPMAAGSSGGGNLTSIAAFGSFGGGAPATAVPVQFGAAAFGAPYVDQRPTLGGNAPGLSLNFGSSGQQQQQQGGQRRKVLVRRTSGRRQ